MLKQMRYWLEPRRPWLWLLLALLLYTLGGFLLAPWLVERQLVRLSAERADLTTSVDTIDINPFTLTFNLEGLTVTDSTAAPLLSLQQVFINFELSSIVRRAWSFDQFHIIDLSVALERYADGETNVGRVVERWQATAPPGQESDAQDEGAPRLIIADLVVASAAVSLVDNVPQQRFETRVDALDLVIANLSTLPDDTAGQDLRLTMGNGAVLSWTGTSSLNPLHSEGRITLQGAYPDLLYDYFQDQLPFDINGSEISAQLDYRTGTDADGALSADITKLQFSMVDTLLTDSDSGAQLLVLPEVTVDNGELHWPANTIAADTILLRGAQLNVVREQDGTINYVALLDALPVTPAPTAASNGNGDGDADNTDPWQYSVAQLSLEDWMVTLNDRTPERDAVIEFSLDAGLTDISSEPDAQMQLTSSIEVDSGGTMSLEGTLVALPQWQFDAELDLAELELAVLQPYIEPLARVSLNQGRLNVEGTVAAAADRQSFSGNVSVAELTLTDNIEEETLFSMDLLQVNGMNLQQSDEPSLDVDEIRITLPYASVQIKEDGSTNIGQVLISADNTDNAPETDTDPENSNADVAAQMMAVAVDRMLIESARVDFADGSLPLPFSVVISDLGGDISTLSTRSEQPAAIDLEGDVGEFGAVTIDGELQPLAFAQNTQVNLAFRNIDMPAMSPYTVEFAGREIDDGRMDIDLSYRIEAGQLDGGNKIIMRDLVLGGRVPHPDAMDLPLGLAVALLEDRNGVINLDVPVSGDIDDPQFDYSQIIRETITNALTSIVTSPFSFLANLVGSGEDDLAAIAFAPGSSDVAPPERQQLEQLAGALEQRPKLRLQIPQVYARQADTQALAQRLLDQRIEQRMEAPAQATANDMTAIARRVMILEDMMISEGLAVRQTDTGDTEVGDASANTPGNSSDNPSGNPSDTTDDPVSLAALQLRHLIPLAEDDEQSAMARLDEPAYADALRTRLLARQSVPAEELETLARARAEQVLTMLTNSRAPLEAQISIGNVVDAAVDDGRVVMTLEVEVDS